MKVIILLISVFTLILGTENSRAEDKKEAEKSETVSRVKRPYGKAGCGLGSLILGDTGTGGQIFAVTTNNTSGSQSFGISSGTSNCKTDEELGATKNASIFIEANQVAFVNDMVRGSGETLSTLSGIFGCQDSRVFGSALQKNYDRVFPSDGASSEQISQNIIKLIERTSDLKCSPIG